jgi:molybdate transport system regulatory protein
MTQKLITIRIPYGTLSAIGPGKADLLEAIERCGSISAAAKEMGMSYKRAWDLVDTMNHAFRASLVVTATGGSHGGGAQMSDMGHEVLRRYRDIESKANASIAAEASELAALLSPAASQKNPE